MQKNGTVLVVDDESGIRKSLNLVLKDEYHVLLAATGKEAIDVCTQNTVDLILLDILLPDMNGVDLLERIKSLEPGIEVIMITAVKEVQTAVKAMKLGAYEYIVKPFAVDDVLNIIQRAFEKHDLLKEVNYLRQELRRYQSFEKIVGEDETMKRIFELISMISDSDGAVFIHGESGTGKELVARAIHNCSIRKNHPFVVINCATIPTNLMESEIFGHQKGAFTGATQTVMGKLEIADKGTVFLDDIDLLDINMQAKLLRVIQEKEFERLGSNKVNKVDVRFVAATNKDINEIITQGRFREDLFYRLSVFPINIPPLRKRKTDIPLLLEHFLACNAKNTGKPPKRFSKRAMNSLMRYNWPGNVRELENLVERTFTITKDAVIHLKDISIFHIGSSKMKDATLKEALSNFERQYIIEILDIVEGSRKKAAEMLGIHRNTLLVKMNDLGLK